MARVGVVVDPSYAMRGLWMVDRDQSCLVVGGQVLFYVWMEVCFGLVGIGFGCGCQAGWGLHGRDLGV